MSKRFITRLGFTALALAFAVSSPAFATGKKTSHHPMHNQSSAAGDSGNAQVDQLNAQSLSAAQQGQNFMPSGSASTRSSAPMGGSPMGGQGGGQGGAQGGAQGGGQGGAM